MTTAEIRLKIIDYIGVLLKIADQIEAAGVMQFSQEDVLASFDQIKTDRQVFENLKNDAMTYTRILERDVQDLQEIIQSLNFENK